MQTPPARRVPRALILVAIITAGSVACAAYSTVMAAKMRHTIAEIVRLNTACAHLNQSASPTGADRECTPGMTLHPGESCTRHIIIELQPHDGSI